MVWNEEPGGGGGRLRGSDGRFKGLRVDLESVPRLPAWLLDRIWQDGRTISIRWEREDARTVPFEASREEGNAGVLRVWVHAEGSLSGVILSVQRLPAPNGGAVPAVRCPEPACGRLVRHLYLREVWWQCRRCGGLRYASEGGALIWRSRGFVGRLLGLARDSRDPRPEPWDPGACAI